MEREREIQPMIGVDGLLLNACASEFLERVVVLIVLGLEEEVEAVVGCLRVERVHLVTRARERVGVGQTLPRLLALRRLCVLQVRRFLHETE